VQVTPDELEDTFVLRGQGLEEHDYRNLTFARDAVNQNASVTSWMQPGRA
jgi:hypothetical protein